MNDLYTILQLCPYYTNEGKLLAFNTHKHTSICILIFILSVFHI